MNRRAGRLLALVILPLVACTAVAPRNRSPVSAGDVNEDGQLAQVLVAIRELPPSLRDGLGRELAGEYELEARGSWPLSSLELECLLFDLPENGADLADVVQRLARDHRVELVAPISLFHTLQSAEARPDSYRKLQYSRAALRLDEAHRITTGRDVLVALVDTGVDINHSELRANVTQARNFVRWDRFAGDLHGTAVAGVLAARDDGQGIVGVAPQARLLALKACWHEDPLSIEALCTSYTLAQAIDAAILGQADVLNLSLTGPSDPILESLVELALERGIAVIAASDEGGRGFPGSHDGVLAVRAADSRGRVLTETRKTRDGEIVAPGIDVLTTVPGGRYDFLSGSSLAAAHVSGLVALLLEERSDLSPEALGSILYSGSGPADGRRLADACTALARLLGGDPCGDG